MSDQPTSQPPLEADGTALRDALDVEARRVDPTPDWAGVRRRASRARGRGVVYAVAAAAMVGLVAVAVPVLLPDRGGEVVVAPGFSEEPSLLPMTEPELAEPIPTASTDATASPSPSPSPAPATDPTPNATWPALEVPSGEPLASAEVVAVVQRETLDEFVHDIVVVDAGGQVVRTLAEGVSTSEGGVYKLSLSPDGRTVLYARGTSACTGVVEALSADGSSSAAVRLFDGNAAVLSLDRGLMARDPRNDCLNPPNQIEIVPTAGGRAQLFGENAAALNGLGAGSGGGLESLAFIGGDTLLYTIRTDEGSQLDGGLWALDVPSGTDRRVDPMGENGRYRWLHAMDEQRVVALHEGSGGWEVVVIDTDTVFSAVPTPGGEAAHQASISDVLGTVVARGFGVPTLMIEGEVVRSDVVAALTFAGSFAPRPQTSTPPLGDAQKALARDRVDQLLNAFVAGDFAEAARHWSGYPDVAGDDQETVAREIAAGRDVSDWPMLRANAGTPEVHVTPAWAFEDPTAAVVTFLYPDGPTALAFLVDITADPGELGAVIRLPSWRLADEENPMPGGEVTPGSGVVIPGVPIEGGAVAHVNGVAVPVQVDHERFETTVTIPTDATGVIALTLSLATPEAPGAIAFALRVVPPS